ncbi:MAG: NADH-ubiquinone oxidoreductase-F iron-sulfur binding region domain-containing protein [Syntrophomonadaceae bacterium]|jgi:NADH-quinone oxidoreductase subunit F
MKLRIGLGSCGIAAGALNVQDTLQAELTNRGINIEVQPTGCVGMCHNEPLVDIIEDNGQVYTYGHVNEDNIKEIIEGHIINGLPVEKYLVQSSDKKNRFMEGQPYRISLRNCGIINPEKISDYIEKDGYKGLQKALGELTPEEVIEQIKISGLRGRGGAGFPTWFKWDAARNNPGQVKYVICNADEGDPGAFMDRSVLESDPHSVVEGMAIAAYAIGANEGVIYCRAEYPLAIHRLETAINQAKEHGYLGQNILNSNFSFDIRIKQGAGAFVCGEETALIASLEGERGMPRLKPPFPAQAGYWGKPSNINNVETLANVAWIIANGGEAFAARGSEKSKGTKVFALAGKIKNGGLIEVPMGLSLREVIYDIGGGIKEDRAFKAVQLGGPSGGCIPSALLDTPVDYESITATGAIMGSGGMVVMDEGTCMVDVARFFLDFTEKESCGKCVQCRIGTKRLLEILERICNGEGRPGDLELLEEIALKVKEGSLCGLGQSAPNPVLTTIKYFRDEYEAHINDKTCPAKQCKALISYRIDPEKCKGCGLCAKKCPVNCISGERKQPYVIDQQKCIKCGNCFEVCPTKVSAVILEGGGGNLHA